MQRHRRRRVLYGSAVRGKGMKRAGMLLPVFSLPGKYGIGTLGKEAFRFIDLLSETGNSVWQVLPMGPTGFGDSPYQSFSAFAGNPYFVDLETLTEEKLLTEADCAGADSGEDECRIDYEKIYNSRRALLFKAYENWLLLGNNASDLVKKLRPETLEYCVFMAIKTEEKGASWNVWPEELRDCGKTAVAAFRASHEKEIGFHAFVQMKFEEQWAAVRSYAAEKGIQILGDIPIYCAPDSADAWAHRELFQFDALAHPKSVAGVPPDAFSATGQLWGNPLYDWDMHKKTGYSWWLARLTYCLSLYDALRVDHFRGFEAYYSVPYGEETAENGRWVDGPGMSLFNAMYTHFGTRKLPIIAEDLGVITDSVRALMEETGFPGMKVLQFAFDAGSGNAYLPHNFTTPNCICYTGTHDNDTLRHWFETLPDGIRNYIYQYLSRSGNDWNAMPELLIKTAMGTIADTVIIPAGDYLNLGAEGRINQPGTSGSNWQWRMKADAFTEQKKQVISQIVGVYGRYQEAPAHAETETETEAPAHAETEVPAADVKTEEAAVPETPADR